MDKERAKAELQYRLSKWIVLGLHKEQTITDIEAATILRSLLEQLDPPTRGLEVFSLEKKVIKIEKPMVSLQKFSTRVRVAAYARVSTNKVDQEMSLEAQIDYFEKYVKEHLGWDLVEVYYDNGQSGTSYRKREGFKRMIADCEAGKIDRIVTKSISRFARNTVDTVKTIRMLKAKGIGIFFQKEDIWTLDGKSEFILTLMASFAQEESRSISENVAWGQRKKFADGCYWIGYSNFLGYDRDFVINKEEAAIVKRIYRRYIQGLTFYSIALELNQDDVLSMQGKEACPRRIGHILRNVKYKGDAITQVEFTENFLTRKHVKNTGQLPQYYVTGGHDAIITPEVFDYVQELIEDRKDINGRYSGMGLLNSKFRCGKCGSIFGAKPIHSNDEYRHNIWQCHNRFRKGNPCHNRFFHEKEIEPLLRFIMLEILKKHTELESNLAKIISDIIHDKSREIEIEEAIGEFIQSGAAVDMDEFAWIVEKIIVIDEELTVEVFGGLTYKIFWPIKKIRKKKKTGYHRRKKEKLNIENRANESM